VKETRNHSKFICIHHHSWWIGWIKYEFYDYEWKKIKMVGIFIKYKDMDNYEHVTCKLSSFSLQQLLFTLYSLKYTLSHEGSGSFWWSMGSLNQEKKAFLSYRYWVTTSSTVISYLLITLSSPQLLYPKIMPLKVNISTPLIPSLCISQNNIHYS